MRVIITSLCLVLASNLPGFAEPSEVEKAVRSALSWYDRWIEPLADGEVTVKCSVAVFERKAFAYCEPDSLGMDIAIAGEASPHVTYIGHPMGHSFQEALRYSYPYRSAGREPTWTQETLSIPLRELRHCKVDWSRTAQTPSMAFNQAQRKMLQSKGLSLRYPVICDGDPFYFIYLMEGEKIWSIWQHTVYPDRLDFSWSYDAESDQRKLPKLAEANLRKKELWYRADVTEKK